MDREREGEDPDIGEYWNAVKREVIRVGKEREEERNREENGRKNFLEGMHHLMAERGDVAGREETKRELDEIYNRRAVRKLNRIKREIYDKNVYDEHTLQRQRKFENQSKVKELKIGNNVFHLSSC